MTYPVAVAIAVISFATVTALGFLSGRWIGRRKAQ